MVGEIMVGAEFGVEQQDEALAFLRSVDSELARLLDLHSLPHVALTLALFGREATDLGLFFEQHDARSGRQMDDMLDHLGISARQASEDIAKLKSEWLSVFPKVTMPGDTHSFAGFSKSPPCIAWHSTFESVGLFPGASTRRVQGPCPN